MRNEKFWNDFFKGIENHCFTGCTVIHATFLNKDLIPTFFNLLKSFDPEKAKEFISNHSEMEKALKELEENEYKEISYFESEDSFEDLNSLMDLLDSFSPEGFYFGSNEGDFSDFGYWLNEETYEEYYNNGWL